MVDPTGYGTTDASLSILRFPFAFTRNSWDVSIYESDRLLGMRLLRYINFRARGYQGICPPFRSFVIKTIVRLVESGKIEEALKTFVQRKLVVSSRHNSLTKSANFSAAFITDFNEVLGEGGSEFYGKHINPLFQEQFQAKHPS